MNPFSLQLDELKQRSLFRNLNRVDTPQGPEILIGGRRFLNFSSNDYLGLASDSRLVRAAERALRAWGTGSGASRLISGSLAVHEELESRIAAFKGEERALVFSSGFMANLGAVTALAGPQDTVWIDRFSHASLVDAARLSGARLRVFPHRDFETLVRWLKRGGLSARQIIATESYFSMDGDISDLSELASIAKKFGALLLVDDAHATGIFGPGGRGLTTEFGVEGKIDLVMGTFSKALGSHGGFLAGKVRAIEYLVNRARSFIYTTAPSPASSGASIEAIRIAEEDPSLREMLWANVKFLRQRLEDAGFDLMGSEGPIIPVLTGDSERALLLSKRLYEKGIYIPAIRPPTVPKRKDRLRITVSAKHSEAQMGKLVETLKGVCSSS